MTDQLKASSIVTKTVLTYLLLLHARHQEKVLYMEQLYFFGLHRRYPSYMSYTEFDGH